MKAKVEKKKMSMKEKAAVFVLLKGVPFLLDSWRKAGCKETFDEYCENLLREVK